MTMHISAAMKAIALLGILWLPLSSGSWETVEVTEGGITFKVAHKSSSRRPYRVKFTLGGVRSVYRLNTTGRVKKVTVGSEQYFVSYRSDGDLKSVHLLSRRRGLVAREKDEIEGEDEVRFGESSIRNRRRLFACEDCQQTWDTVCDQGAPSVCDLVGYGYPLSDAANTSTATMCETFGSACSNHGAGDVCLDQCHDVETPWPTPAPTVHGTVETHCGFYECPDGMIQKSIFCELPGSGLPDECGVETCCEVPDTPPPTPAPTATSTFETHCGFYGCPDGTTPTNTFCELPGSGLPNECSVETCCADVDTPPPTPAPTATSTIETHCVFYVCPDGMTQKQMFCELPGSGFPGECSVETCCEDTDSQPPTPEPTPPSTFDTPPPTPAPTTTSTSETHCVFYECPDGMTQKQIFCELPGSGLPDECSVATCCEDVNG